MSCFYQHASLPFNTPYQETPLRGQPRPQQPPTNPDICSFTRLFFPPCGFRACFFAFSSMSVKIDQFMGEQVVRLQRAPPPVPWDTQICTWGQLPEILLYWLKWRERKRGGMTKTTACVGEHCLRLRLEIFSGKTGFYTQWSWVWRKGAHIKRSAFMCAQLLFFKLHLYGEGPTCSVFPY